jgi:RimJ/RimL family protein N-acetyltransferase
MLVPFHTPRLLVRSFRPDDADGLWQRRNDPEVARYQNWTVPFPRERVASMLEDLVGNDEPVVDEWWMAAVAERDTDEVVGDLAVHLTWEGRTAEIGYTFGRAHWGRGYALEAVGGLLGRLFERPETTRVFGMLHPDNVASAMLLERTGFLFEGHTRSSYWVGEEVSDDWIYGMTRADHQAWRARSSAEPGSVLLVDITPDNLRDVRRLQTHRSQEAFVAPMGASFADALVPEVVDGAPVEPWYRAVEADGEIVGFVMLARSTEHHPEPFLWRMLIDRLHQRRGIGTRAVALVEEVCREAGDATLLTSWVEGRGSPAPFYRRLGFEPTGEIDGGEVVGRKRLT